MPSPDSDTLIAVIGAGPAGLMAAEVLQAEGHGVHVFDAMPTAGRKFLLAGVGGLNLTHSEPRDAFAARYGARARDVERWLAGFDAAAVRGWAGALGHETFVGTSGHVFPVDMKAAPLLRAWLHRLRAATAGGRPVQFHMRHRWNGRLEGAAVAARRRLAVFFDAPAGELRFEADAVVLALGGASWPRLGSDGAWVATLAARGVDIAPLGPANCGFDVAPTAPGRAGWSDHLRERHAGAPIKSVAMMLRGRRGDDGNGGEGNGDDGDGDGGDGKDGDGDEQYRQLGEFVITATGIEGSLVYAFSARLRERIAREGRATILLDLLPRRSFEQVLAEVRRPRGARSLSTHLKSRLNLQGAKAALLHELLTTEQLHQPDALARAIKALPIALSAARPVDEAISTAGGVRLEAMDDGLMLRALPGVFCGGEMLDWEAPTGGYLLTACLASGRVAAQGVSRWLAGGASPETR